MLDEYRWCWRNYRLDLGLEIGISVWLSSSCQAISYCGLCSAQKELTGKEHRRPISKKRNKHLLAILDEASKLSPYLNPHLVAVRQKELERGNRNRATLAVARKLVEYRLSVDRCCTPFVSEKPPPVA